MNGCRDLARSRKRWGWEPLDENIPFSQPEESALFQAVMALPEKLRVTVHLHYYEGYTTAEIAPMLGVREGTVRSLLSRARGKLRVLLTDEEAL